MGLLLPETEPSTMSVLLAQEEEHVRELVEHLFDLIVAPLFLCFKPSAQEILWQLLIGCFFVRRKEKGIPALPVARMASSLLPRFQIPSLTLAMDSSSGARFDEALYTVL